MELYPRGFLIAREPVKLPEDLDTYVHRFFAGIHMWSDVRTDTAVRINRSSAIAIHGHAGLDTTKAALNNLNEIANILLTDYTDNGLLSFEELLDSLAGRYAVILVQSNGKYRIYHDAHGMRSVYFSNENQMVASHANLLAEVIGVNMNENRIESKVPLWVAWEKTKYDAITALIPNHCYEEDVASQIRYYPRAANRYTQLSNDQRVAMIAELWQKQLDSYMRDKQIAMSVTAGLDSRVALALAEKHITKIPSFTYTHDSGGYNSAKSWKMDKDVVEQIKKYIPLDHKFLRYEDRRQPTAEQTNVLDRNTLSRHGRWILSLYPEVFTDNSMLHLRSNSHETGRAFFPRKTNDNQIERIGKIVRALHSKAGVDTAENSSSAVDPLDKCKSLGYDSLASGFEPLDLFYWEFRMGRWVSEVYNETDVCFDTFTPYNMRKIIELSLSFSVEDRTEGTLFKEMINVTTPILNFFGINSTKNIYETQKVSRPEVPSNNTDEGTASAEQDFKAICQRRDYKIQTNDSSTYLRDFEFLQIPASDLIKNNECGTEFELEGQDTLRIRYLNKFTRQAAEGYMQFSISIDGRKLLGSDLIEDSSVTGYEVKNLSSRKILIEFKLVVLKSCVAESWSRASRTWIHQELTENNSLADSAERSTLPQQVKIRELSSTKWISLDLPELSEIKNG